VRSLGKAPIGWTVDCAGWLGTSGGWSRDKVVRRALDALQPGEIILMHLGSNPRDGTTLDVDGLPEVIARIEAAGYRFVALDEVRM
jgi:peptidoglycan/xylan/chitin deacetylase (PgdA/CDA1 family)